MSKLQGTGLKPCPDTGAVAMLIPGARILNPKSSLLTPALIMERFMFHFLHFPA
jgi:hypothetical protein